MAVTTAVKGGGGKCSHCAPHSLSVHADFPLVSQSQARALHRTAGRLAGWTGRSGGLRLHAVGRLRARLAPLCPLARSIFHFRSGKRALGHPLRQPHQFGRAGDGASWPCLSSVYRPPSIGPHHPVRASSLSLRGSLCGCTEAGWEASRARQLSLPRRQRAAAGFPPSTLHPAAWGGNPLGASSATGGLVISASRLPPTWYQSKHWVYGTTAKAHTYLRKRVQTYNHRIIRRVTPCTRRKWPLSRPSKGSGDSGFARAADHSSERSAAH